MFKKKKQTNKAKNGNVSTLKTFGFIQTKLVFPVRRLPTHSKWLPDSSTNNSNLSCSKTASSILSNSNHSKNGDLWKNPKRGLSMFNTSESEGESAFKENPKQKVFNRKRNQNVKKKKVFSKTQTKKGKPQRTILGMFNNIQNNSNASLKSHNGTKTDSVLKDRKPLILSHNNTSVSEARLHNSVLDHGPEMISDVLKSNKNIQNIQSTPFMQGTKTSLKPLPLPLHLSGVNNSKKENNKPQVCMNSMHEDLHPDSQMELFSPLSNDSRVNDNGSSLDLFSPQNVENLEHNKTDKSVSPTISLASSVLNHGPEVDQNDLFTVPKGRRRMQIIKGDIHSTPAMLNINGRKEKLLGYCENLQMSESLLGLDGKPLNVTEKQCNNAYASLKNKVEIKSNENKDLKKLNKIDAKKKNGPKNFKRLKVKNKRKVPFWKSNLSIAQRTSKMLKNNHSIASQIMQGVKVCDLPNYMNNSSNIYNMNSDTSNNSSNKIDLRKRVSSNKKEKKELIADYLFSDSEIRADNLKRRLSNDNDIENNKENYDHKNAVDMLLVKNNQNDSELNDTNCRKSNKEVTSYKDQFNPKFTNYIEDENEDFVDPKKNNNIVEEKPIIENENSLKLEGNAGIQIPDYSVRVMLTDIFDSPCRYRDNVDNVGKGGTGVNVPVTTSDGDDDSDENIKDSPLTRNKKPKTQHISSSSDSDEYSEAGDSKIEIDKNKDSSLSDVFNEVVSHRTPNRKSVRSPGSRAICSSVCRTGRRSGKRFSFIHDKSSLDLIKVDLTDVFAISPSPIEIKEDIDEADTKECQILLDRLSQSFIDRECKADDSKQSHEVKIQKVSCLSSRRSISSCRQKVLEVCNQNKPILFNKFLSKKKLISCRKLGEGVYGEVFRCTFKDEPMPLAIKVVPVEGKLIVNNEKQKTFQEVLPEVICSGELSHLRNTSFDQTDAFIPLHKVHCIEGEFPECLLQAWDEFDEERGSENDRPHIFGPDQLYIVFAFMDGGIDIEHYEFKHAGQGTSILQQVALGLAVAEKVYHFEHRDLHWGNVLVCETREPVVKGYLNGKEIVIKTFGVKAYIIDFTMSRLTKENITLFQNLALDPELFTMDSVEDYQFEIYRMMKKATLDEWYEFTPVTNIYWMHYLIDKFLTQVNYKRNSKKMPIHIRHRKSLNKLKENVLLYSSCMNLVNDF